VDSARAELAGLILHALSKDAQAPAAPGSTPVASPSDCTTTACTAPAAVSPAAPAATPQGGLAAIGYPGGGCSSTGPQSLWLAIPAFAFFALRRRRSV